VFVGCRGNGFGPRGRSRVADRGTPLLDRGPQIGRIDRRAGCPFGLAGRRARRRGRPSLDGHADGRRRRGISDGPDCRLRRLRSPLGRRRDGRCRPLHHRPRRLGGCDRRRRDGHPADGRLGRCGSRRRLDGGWVGRRRLTRGDDRCGCCGRLGGRRHRRRVRRQKGDRIEVPLRVGRRPDPHADVRFGNARLVGRPDRADRRALGHARTPPHLDRAEVQERDGPARGRLDRHGLAGVGHRAGERDGAFGGGEHGRADLRRDVDPAMLAGRIRMVMVEVEAAQNLTLHRPGPRAR
jgi:hypothetical protein